LTVFVIYAANNCHATLEQTLFDRDLAKRTDFVFLAYQFDPDMIREKGLEFDRTEKWVFSHPALSVCKWCSNSFRNG
jgi:hypothetical protein